jgi:selenocysteine-specific elongation factor
LLAGVPVPPSGEPLPDVVEVGDWLVADDRWREWHEQLSTAVVAWARDHPMTPGMPRASVVQELALPDAALLDALLPDLPNLVVDADGVHARDQLATLPPTAEAELEQIVAHLASAPFEAPEAPQLSAAGLTERHLAVAVRAGRLVRIALGIYLLPDAVDEATRRLAVLPQPFTAAQARESLGTTRRVALPLLELLDRLGRTERVDAQLRRVRG